MRLPKVHFYVDSFGLGHITRQIAVARALSDQAQITFFSRDHLDFIRNSLPNAEVEKTNIGINLVQKNIGLDVQKTQKLNAEGLFVKNFESGLAEENLRLKSDQPDVIVADIPGEIFLAAEKYDIPTIAVSNFGWTVILEHVLGKDSVQYEYYSQAYKKSSKTLVLPFNEPMKAFSNKKNVGLLRRRVGRKFNKKNAIVTTFGKSVEEINFPLKANNSFYSLPLNDTESQDYISASSGIFTKPSYGAASEAVSSGVRLFLLAREDFPESDYIKDQLLSEKCAIMVPGGLSPKNQLNWILDNSHTIDQKNLDRVKKKYSDNSDQEIAEAILSI
ncbi:MAG: hypothetical protein ACP5N9_02155 [Candidatus Bilamarchaeum sp.]|jgi:hypothetical protein